jgi:hypothetical protein
MTRLNVPSPVVLSEKSRYLQTDAYASYESVVLESAGRIVPVSC